MINFPSSFSEVLTDLRNGFQAANSDANPFLRTGFLKSILDTLSGRFFDLYRKSKQVLNQAFVSTCDDDILTIHGSEYGLTPLAAEYANGYVIITGTASTTVPNGARLVASNGLIFDTLASAIITDDTVTITSINRTLNVATIVATNHQISTGKYITISGCNQTEYNATFIVTAIDKDTLTISVDDTFASSVTGTPVFNISRAIVSVQCESAGIDGNLSSNETLNFITTIANIDSTAGVIFSGFTGGTDDETSTAYRNRILDFKARPVAPFNAYEIEKTIKDNITTATRLRVYPVTPAAGQVTIYFVEDGKSNILPSSTILAQALASLGDIKPAEVASSNIFVLAPTLVTVDFTFTALSPNTSSMREAITANLTAYLATVNIGDSIPENNYKSIIANTLDTVTGDSLDSFSLSVPSGDVLITSSQLGVIGNVTFP